MSSKTAALVKAVVDCSTAGALDQDTAAQLAAELREAALRAVENDDLEKAAILLQDAKDALAAGVAPGHQLVELTEDEIAALEEHQAEQAERLDADRARRLEEVIVRCDRYLAQTDWIMDPAAARPTDMSENLAKACDANAKKWAGWRAKVRAIRDAAVAGTADPADPGFPATPAAPAVSLT